PSEDKILKYNIDNFKGYTRGADSFGKTLLYAKYYYSGVLKIGFILYLYRYYLRYYKSTYGFI
ncbi:hypothetical protein N7537_008254, partial [Penicillium hordei]